MATLLATTEEEYASRRGGGNIITGDSWEERFYNVYFTDSTANSLDARNAVGVPAWGAQLGSYALYVQEKNATPDPSDSTIWRVSVMYKTLTTNQQQPRFNATTSKWNVVKTITSFPTEIPIQKDIHGKVTLNCIGEPIQVKQVIYDAKLVISYMTDSFDFSIIDGCLGCTNISTVNITVGGAAVTFPANTMLLQNYSVQDEYDIDGDIAAAVQLEFLYKSDTHQLQFPNISFNQSVSWSAQPVTIADGNGQPSSGGPWYLDAAGHKLNNGDSIVMNTFDVVDVHSFAGLLLDIT